MQLIVPAFYRSCLLAALLPCAAVAQRAPKSFDWSLLEGNWAESADHAFGCRTDNLHFKFVPSADKKRLTFKLDRKWPIAGEEVSEYSAEVVEASGRMLVIRYGPELTRIPAEMREWELLFIGPGTYRWRATAWRPGQYNTVIGVKCTAQ
jgi:hypothetical protein